MIEVSRSEGRFIKNSPIIDIPGERRTLRRIDFHYQSINRRQGKGTVEVLGR